MWQTVQEGTGSKRVHAGMSSGRPIVSAELARTGLTAAVRWLTGRHGLARVITIRREFEWPAMFADRADEYLTRDVGLKPYAACLFTPYGDRGRPRRT